jgi:hypothetical protein
MGIHKMDSFNFDLERMKIAVAAKSYQVPEHISNIEEFDEWLDNVNKKLDQPDQVDYNIENN